MTAPLIAAEIDLGQWHYFPLLRQRLFRSQFHFKASNQEWRGGVTLWAKSYDQKPVGSLPNDDAELWRLTDLKGNIRTWFRIKPMVMHGWVLCDDGRFYHPLIAEIVNGAWRRRQSLPETKRERRRKTVARDDSVEKDTPLPPQGDFLKFDGVRPPRAPIEPRVIGHSLPCACPTCSRWVEWQAELAKRTA